MAEEKFIKLPIFDIDKKVEDIQSDEGIKKVQEKLIELGHFINNHGKFDRYTFGAICNYQRKNKLNVNGEITEETWNKLFGVKEKERSKKSTK